MFDIPKGQTKTIPETDDTYFVSYAEGVNTSPGDETALVVETPDEESPHSFFILNGDWIDKYEKCKSKKEQLELFLKNFDEHAGSWTEPKENAEAIYQKL